MDINRAFTWFRQDPQWVSKLAIAVAMSFVPILSLAGTGYMLEITKRVYYGQDLPLPEWDNFGDKWVKGLLLAVGQFLWMAPIILVFVAGVLVASLVKSSILLAVVMAVGIPALLVVTLVLQQVLMARYAIFGTFNSVFQFGEVINEAKSAFGSWIGAGLVYFGAAIVGVILSVLTLCLGFIVLPTWLSVGQASLVGQVYRSARGVDMVPPSRPDGQIDLRF